MKRLSILSFLLSAIAGIGDGLKVSLPNNDESSVAIETTSIEAPTQHSHQAEKVPWVTKETDSNIERVSSSDKVHRQFTAAMEIIRKLESEMERLQKEDRRLQEKSDRLSQLFMQKDECERKIRALEARYETQLLEARLQSEEISKQLGFGNEHHNSAPPLRDSNLVYSDINGYGNEIRVSIQETELYKRDVIQPIVEHGRTLDLRWKQYSLAYSTSGNSEEERIMVEQSLQEALSEQVHFSEQLASFRVEMERVLDHKDLLLSQIYELYSWYERRKEEK